MNSQNKDIGIVSTKIASFSGDDSAITLSCGQQLTQIDIAYETYGTLNDSGDNVVLVCHALSGDAHAAGFGKESNKKPGWWHDMIGAGKGIDTNKYFVICSNFLGSCSGTTGPGSIDPATDKPYGNSFPVITIGDMVKAQKLLLDSLGITELLCVVGGSIGGMQALQWAIDYPDFVKSVIPIATTARLSAQSIAFDAVSRNVILADSDFNGGNYSSSKTPDSGLSIARMIGHITYLSEEGMHKKFGRQLQNSDSYEYDINSEFAVESYLDYQGKKFVERFDANSYLYITRAMDYFDPAKDHGSLEKAFADIQSRFLIISFASDWLFTPNQSKQITSVLAACGKDVSYCNIDSPYGHDSFLLEPKILGDFISGFLAATFTGHNNKVLHPPNVLSQHQQNCRSRVDYQVIESLIEPNSKVLDIGCGDGQLLNNLITDKNIAGEGIELEQAAVLQCVNRGLPIIQHDIEDGLSHYGDKSFDTVILSHTMQTVKNPEKVFTELLRVGKKVIVSFPNFAHWQCRLQLFLSGRAPISKQLPFTWHNSSNVHFLSLKDFDQFCKQLNVTIDKRIPLIKTKVSPVKFAPNLFAEQAIYVTSKD